MPTLDDVDEYDSRRYFGLHRRTPPDALCRRVLELSGTGVDFSTLPTETRAAVLLWASALGSLAPSEPSDLSADPGALRQAARGAAGHVSHARGDRVVAKLAAALYPTATARSPEAILAVIGFRTLSNSVVNVSDALDSEPDDDPHDQYTDIARRTPGTRVLDD